METKTEARVESRVYSPRTPPLGAGARSGAIVIGGDYRGLGVVRSLGRHKIPVWVLADEHIVATSSRYARRSLPWPAGDEDSQVAYLIGLAVKYGLKGWALFPSGDETASLIARHHAVLGQWFMLTVPPWEVMQWAYDKRLTYKLAAELGIDCPQTYYPSTEQEVAQLDVHFPAILKPAIKVGFNSFTHAKAWRVEDRQQLIDRYKEACSLVDPEIVMVQELIAGGGRTQLSYAALCEGGVVHASLTARRTRQYPVDFGRASTYVETASFPEIEEPSRRLLSALNFTGLVEVEFKLDTGSGQARLLDINARVWGWHSLCPRAGVDFPYLLWRQVRGESLPRVHARTGVRWVRMSTDLMAVAKEILSGRLSPGGYLESLRGPMEFAIFARDDPLPALLEFPQLFRIMVKRGAA